MTTEKHMQTTHIAKILYKGNNILLLSDRSITIHSQACIDKLQWDIDKCIREHAPSLAAGLLEPPPCNLPAECWLLQLIPRS